jgi:AhpD family alkylhydroperoxidase
MEPRIDVTKHLNSGIGKAMFALSQETEKSIDRRLFELVKIRASQINGCAYCIDMHTKDARALGESEQRIYALSAWGRLRFSPNANGLRSSGPKRSRAWPRPTCPTMCTRTCRHTSVRRSSSH